MDNEKNYDLTKYMTALKDVLPPQMPDVVKEMLINNVFYFLSL